MQEAVFKKEDTGMDYNEIFKYEKTDHVDLCYNCRFKWNLSVVAPCNDCNGYHDTGRNYFQED